MKQFSKIFILSIMTLVAINSSAKVAQGFAKVENNHFVVNEKPYYFVGTNFWFGAILGSKGQGGDKARLIKELDFMKENGLVNLRVLIGSDGSNGIPSKVEPTLQIKAGVYNDTIFDGLDFLLSELGKRDMKAVLFFTNSWEWSGGYSQYLNWAGKGKNPVPSVDGWPAYMDFVKQYAGCDECCQMLKNHIKHVITRTNRYTKKKYTQDPAIFSWQIGNEPRAFSDANKPLFVAWLKDISAYIKSLDKNHMVSIGSEGQWGCEMDMGLSKFMPIKMSIT
jgi:mannan endo-1,4-beta-mannosidase